MYCVPWLALLFDKARPVEEIGAYLVLYSTVYCVLCTVYCVLCKVYSVLCIVYCVPLLALLFDKARPVEEIGADLVHGFLKISKNKFKSFNQSIFIPELKLSVLG